MIGVEPHAHSRIPLPKPFSLSLQIFFHDPEHNMIEVCNCDEFPVEFLEPNPAPTYQACPSAWAGVKQGSKDSDLCPAYTSSTNSVASESAFISQGDLERADDTRAQPLLASMSLSGP